MAKPEWRQCERNFLTRRWHLLVPVVFALHATSGQAYELSLSPLFELEGIYSDNKDLAPDDEAQSGYITRGSVGFAASGEGLRTSFDARYALDAVVDNDEADSQEVFHRLDSRAEAELIRRHLFLNGTAAATQEAKDLRRPVSSDRTNATGNVQQTYAWSLGPTLVNRVGNFAQSELAYTYDEVRYRDDDALNTDAHTVDWRLGSPARGRSLTWALNAHYQEIHGDELETGTFSRGSLELGYALTGRLRVTGTGGYEEDDYTSDRAETEGEFWDVGFEWAPSPRSRFSAGYGEHYYGEVWRASLSHERRWLTIDASYSESLTSTRSFALEPAGTVDVFDPSCPRSDPTCAPVDTIRIFETQPVRTFVLAERARVSIAARITDWHRVTLTGATLNQEYQVDDERIYEEGADLRWEIGADAPWRASISGGWTQYRFYPEDRQDELWRGDASVSRELFSNARLRLAVRRQERDSTDPGAEYRENSVALAFLYGY